MMHYWNTDSEAYLEGSETLCGGTGTGGRPETPRHSLTLCHELWFVPLLLNHFSRPKFIGLHTETSSMATHQSPRLPLCPPHVGSTANTLHTSNHQRSTQAKIRRYIINP